MKHHHSQAMACLLITRNRTCSSGCHSMPLGPRLLIVHEYALGATCRRMLPQAQLSHMQWAPLCLLKAR